jgi:hypothetical protein
MIGNQGVAAENKTIRIGTPGTHTTTHLTGDVLIDGIALKSGADGAKGDKGDPGAQGIQGISGLPGAPGADGATGSQGRIGLTGADGARGPIGLTGPAGAQGAQGDPGPGFGISYLSIPGIAFDQTGPDFPIPTGRGSAAHRSGFFDVAPTTIGAETHLSAPVNLPHGAVVRGFTVHAFDIDPDADITIRLCGGRPSVVLNNPNPTFSWATNCYASVTSSGAPGAVALTAVINEANNFRFVDNSTQAHIANVIFQPPTRVPPQDSLRMYRLSIEYELAP